ncbi:hypothetical protein E4U55_001912 [Claviceps digitariae]|nr:hypothetical protein E4U55_001912 [Claviceps digitariae]
MREAAREKLRRRFHLVLAFEVGGSPEPGIGKPQESEVGSQKVGASARRDSELDDTVKYERAERSPSEAWTPSREQSKKQKIHIQDPSMAAPSLTRLPPAYEQALRLIDEAHAEDPNKVEDKEAYELHYARKMTKWLAVRCPDASPALQVACRAQHFRRWQLPRSTFPMTRPGYLSWRAKQKSQAASQVASLLTSSTIQPPLPDGERERIAALIRKEGLSTDCETKVLEDVACLVFLDDQLDDFEAKPEVDEEKMVGILRKTWAKMTEQGRRLALEMQLSDRANMLIGKALEG